MTVSKIQILGGPKEYVPVLQAFIGIENLPSNYGGTLLPLDSDIHPYTEIMLNLLPLTPSATSTTSTTSREEAEENHHQHASCGLDGNKIENNDDNNHDSKVIENRSLSLVILPHSYATTNELTNKADKNKNDHHHIILTNDTQYSSLWFSSIRFTTS